MLNDNEKIEILMGLTIGELRERTAWADGELTLEEFVIELDGLCLDEESPCENCEYRDDCNDYCDEYDEDDVYDYNYDEDDEEDEDYSDTALTAEEQDLCDRIINDIDNGMYSVNALQGLYPQHIIDYVNGYVG